MSGKRAALWSEMLPKVALSMTSVFFFAQGWLGAASHEKRAQEVPEFAIVEPNYSVRKFKPNEDRILAIAGASGRGVIERASMTASAELRRRNRDAS